MVEISQWNEPLAAVHKRVKYKAQGGNASGRQPVHSHRKHSLPEVHELLHLTVLRSRGHKHTSSEECIPNEILRFGADTLHAPASVLEVLDSTRLSLG